MGVRFDLQAVSYVSIPLVFALLSPRLMAMRQSFRIWLSVFAGIALFVGMLEPVFYREFHQRLNGLVFQYLAEDPVTVLSMLWHGFPVGRYVLGWALMTWLFTRVLNWCERFTRPRPTALNAGIMGVS
jgi:phosphoglycerol transferase MdoB-like AlkP superfamily enzyme